LSEMSPLSCVTQPLYKSACGCSCHIRQLRVQFSGGQLLGWTLSPSFWEVYKTKILYKWSQVTPLCELNEMGQYFQPSFQCSCMKMTTLLCEPLCKWAFQSVFFFHCLCHGNLAKQVQTLSLSCKTNRVTCSPSTLVPDTTKGTFSSHHNVYVV
jgi:hypothetical protein